MSEGVWNQQAPRTGGQEEVVAPEIGTRRVLVLHTGGTISSKWTDQDGEHYL